MEKVDWEKMTKIITKAVRKMENTSHCIMIDEIRRDYEEPEESQLAKKICDRLDELGDTTLSPIGRREINEAVKGIDLPCKKVHFPKVTGGVVEDFIDLRVLCSDIRGALESFRTFCMDGRYDMEDHGQKKPEDT